MLGRQSINYLPHFSGQMSQPVCDHARRTCTSGAEVSAGLCASCTRRDRQREDWQSNRWCSEHRPSCHLFSCAVFLFGGTGSSSQTESLTVVCRVLSMLCEGVARE